VRCTFAAPGIPPASDEFPEEESNALTALAMASLPALAGAQQGVSFTYQMRSTATGGTSTQTTPYMSTLVQAAGPNMRIEWREGAGAVPMMKPGSYMLVRGADNSLVLVNPDDKSAMLVDSRSLGIGAGRATNNALIKIAQRDAKFDFEDLGPGERILGYATRHVKYTSSATTDVRVMGKKTSSTDQTIGEAWIATKLTGVDGEALRAWGSAFGRGVQQTNADLLPKLADYQRQYGDGIALRTIMITSSTDEKGRARVDTIHMEITDLKSARLDPALFAVPSGYQVADMREVGKAMDSAYKASGLDTVNAKGLAKEAAKEAGKEGAKDAVKGALGGFLRKKKP
jgi:hypothetical protein